MVGNDPQSAKPSLDLKKDWKAFPISVKAGIVFIIFGALFIIGAGAFAYSLMGDAVFLGPVGVGICFLVAGAPAFWLINRKAHSGRPADNSVGQPPADDQSSISRASNDTPTGYETNRHPGQIY